MSTKRPIHPSYLLWFGFFALWWLGSEIAFTIIPVEWRPIWWPTGFVLFGIVEGAGAARRKKETDTWSEFHWLFGKGGPARNPLLVASGWALAWRIGTMPIIVSGQYLEWGPFAYGLVAFTPMILLARGLGRWIKVHFPDQGRTG